MNLGQAIRKLRIERNISLQEMADMIGCDKPYLNNLEANRINPRKSKHLDTIAEIFKVPVPILFLLSLEVNDAVEEKREEVKVVLDHLNMTYLELFTKK